MYWDVTFVKPLSGYRLYVETKDGRRGIFDVNPYLDRGVFRQLRDLHYFNQVGISLGAVTWPREQDIAPETLIEEMVAVESVPEALRAEVQPAASRNACSEERGDPPLTKE